MLLRDGVIGCPTNAGGSLKPVNYFGEQYLVKSKTFIPFLWSNWSSRYTDKS